MKVCPGKNGQGRHMGSWMMGWRWLPGVAIAVTVYVALRWATVAADEKSAILIATLVIIVAFTLKLLDRPKK